MVAVRLRPKKLIICHIIKDSIREAILLINHESGVSHKRLFFFFGGGGGGGGGATALSAESQFAYIVYGNWFHVFTIVTYSPF